MTRREYTPEEKAAALAVLSLRGGNFRDAAREFGTSDRNLRRWAAETPGAIAAIAAQKTADLATLLTDIAYRSAGLERRAIGHLETLGGAELVEHLPVVNRVMGTAIDKAQLVGGEPTERVEYVSEIDLRPPANDD